MKLKILLLIVFFITLHMTAISQQLNVVTWNIHCLPTLICHSGQTKRAPHIGDAIKNSGADVFVVQEMFNKKVYDIVEKKISNSFPYTTGFAKKEHFFKLNSGLVVFSKYPIVYVKKITFKNARNYERFASKGAILVRILKGGKHIDIIDTHLQSDPDHGKNNQDIRIEQYLQIKKELIDSCACDTVILAGDMNTPKELSVDYNQMLSDLDVNDCELNEIDKTFDYEKNGFNIGIQLKSVALDYILYPKKDEYKHETEMIKFQSNWSKNNKDLSDHYAVKTTIYL